MISLWRRTLEPTDLRVELRDGDFTMAHFDNRQEALDWLSRHIAVEEGRISEQLIELDILAQDIADAQESLQEMRNITGWVNAERRVYVGNRRRAGDRRVNRFSPAEDTPE